MRRQTHRHAGGNPSRPARIFEALLVSAILSVIGFLLVQLGVEERISDQFACDGEQEYATVLDRKAELNAMSLDERIAAEDTEAELRDALVRAAQECNHLYAQAAHVQWVCEGSYGFEASPLLSADLASRYSAQRSASAPFDPSTFESVQCSPEG